MTQTDKFLAQDEIEQFSFPIMMENEAGDDLVHLGQGVFDAQSGKVFGLGMVMLNNLQMNFGQMLHDHLADKNLTANDEVALLEAELKEGRGIQVELRKMTASQDYDLNSGEFKVNAELTEVPVYQTISFDLADNQVKRAVVVRYNKMLLEYI